MIILVKRKKKKAGRDVLTCYDKWGCKCEHHNRKCCVPVDFPMGDSRKAFVSEMMQMGAGNHGPDNDHRCEICDRERQEGRKAGFYQLDPVDGRWKGEPLREKLERERKEKARRLARAQRKKVVDSN
mgnify:CR=1 FL=1